MKLKTIAIVGLGLMGGSLAASCRRRFPSSRIIGVSRNRSALAFALKKKWIHQAFPDLRQAVKDANLVVLCTPVDTYWKILNAIDRFASSGTVVTDVGSVKAEVLRRILRKKWRNIEFVSAHPMVGSHEKGIGAARPDLYQKGYVFLIRGEKSLSPAYRFVKNFWKKMAESIVETSALEHDRIVSDISHLPHAAAVCLVLSVGKDSLGFAASGFRDATRIAQGHPTVWLPIFTFNRRALSRSLLHFERKLKAFRRNLSPGRTGELGRMLSSASKLREQI